MAFTKGLFYPTIEIEDDGWLKSAYLFWDQIQTIVPESMQNPYTTDTALALEDVGFLSALRVHPDMPEITDLADEFVEHLTSREGMEFAVANSGRRTHIHPDKVADSLRRRIHDDKV